MTRAFEIDQFVSQPTKQPLGNKARCMISILGWILLAGGTLTFVASLANNNLEIYWVRFLAIGLAVIGFAMLKTTGAL